MSVTATPVALNLKSWKSAAPVCAHPTVFGGPLAKSTTKCTPVPTWVTSTVPNGAVPQVPVQWSDVKSKVIADAAVAPPATAATTVNMNVHWRIIFSKLPGVPRSRDSLALELSGQALLFGQVQGYRGLADGLSGCNQPAVLTS